MSLLLIACGFLATTGLLAIVVGRFPRICSLLGAGGAVAGSVLGLIPVLRVLGGEPVESMQIPWEVPSGSFSVALDPLSAFFALPILVITALAAIYGIGYLQSYQDKKSLGPAWFFYNVLTASMLLVVTARNGVLFLIAWEVMALSSFFLVTFEDEKPEVRDAGWTYLVATHLGTTFLLVFFVLLGRQSGGSLDFADIVKGGAPASGTAGLLFLLAVIGFGTKAGFMPFHVWLPEAHPAAPSHVSAVMSGVMIKTGIYGLFRALTFLGPPQLWWAWMMIVLGLSSGILGILFALAQKDLKRLLAYSSVENIGIIGLGFGTGLLGVSAGKPMLATLGFAGALIHVVNHALFKGMLFLGAGAVLHGTGTAAMDHQGGLLKHMPAVGAAFFVGAASICGLPPFNGFVGEFLIYVGAFQEGMLKNEMKSDLVAIPSLAIIAGLAMIGGTAVACFTKAFGIVFLGSPRSEAAANAHAPGFLMTAPMLLLAACCLLVGLLSPWLVPTLVSVVDVVVVREVAHPAIYLSTVTGYLSSVVVVGSLLLVLVVALAILRKWLLCGREVTESQTWGCGYAQPTPRMQYTTSSYAQSFTDLFQPILRGRKSEPVLTEYFPDEVSLSTEAPEPWNENVYEPAFRTASRLLAKLRWLQHGRVQLYVLYIAVTILFLLIWYLGLST